MKYSLNDASDIFGNVISIQPQILTINGKRVINSKDDNLNKKDNYKKEKSQIENRKDDYNSYENLLSRILDNPLMEIEKESIKKRKKINREEKLINKTDSKKESPKKNEKNNKLESKKTLEKKKPKYNILKTPSNINFKRIKTKDYEINKFENKILDKSTEKNQNKQKQKKNCQRFSQQDNYLKINNFDRIKNNIDLNINKNNNDNEKLSIKDISNKSDIELSKSIHKSEKFSVEGEIISKEKSILKKSQLEEINSSNFDLNQDNNIKSLNNKDVYVLTNQIVNINKKNVINNLDKNDRNNTKITTLTKRSEKKRFKEEYIQTNENVLEKNNVNFTIEGKKNSLFCCF